MAYSITSHIGHGYSPQNHGTYPTREEAAEHVRVLMSDDARLFIDVRCETGDLIAEFPSIRLVDDDAMYIDEWAEHIVEQFKRLRGVEGMARTC